MIPDLMAQAAAMPVIYKREASAIQTARVYSGFTVRCQVVGAIGGLWGKPLTGSHCLFEGGLGVLT